MKITLTGVTEITNIHTGSRVIIEKVRERRRTSLLSRLFYGEKEITIVEERWEIMNDVRSQKSAAIQIKLRNTITGKHRVMYCVPETRFKYETDTEAEGNEVT